MIENIYDYLDKEIFPSGSLRNYKYLSDKLISDLDEQSLKILCDAQTNGGFLISIPKNQNIKLQKDMELNKNIWEIGEINSKYNEKINII